MCTHLDAISSCFTGYERRDPSCKTCEVPAFALLEAYRESILLSSLQILPDRRD